MLRRVARLVLRGAGWLLTPLVLVSAGAIGAIIGLVVAPAFSATIALGVVTFLALLAAVAGLMLWMRVLRTHPGLRHTLEMTVEGVPETPLVQRLMHDPDAEPGGPP